MLDPRYQYERVNVVKIIVENGDDKVLLIQEPSDNAWMPDHWGLPGGKPIEKESFLEAARRKSVEELGYELAFDGIVRIEELLIDGRTVLMFILRAKTNVDEVRGRSKSFKWLVRSEVEIMRVEEFTEFYNRKLLLDYFAGNYELGPLSLVDTLKFYQMVDDSEYKKWLESGK